MNADLGRAGSVIGLCIESELDALHDGWRWDGNVICVEQMLIFAAIGAGRVVVSATFIINSKDRIPSVGINGINLVTIVIPGVGSDRRI